MKIESLKELESLIRACNKLGVREISIDGIAMKLDGAPEAPKAKQADTAKDAPSLIEESEYTEDQLLNWSSAPVTAHG